MAFDVAVVETNNGGDLVLSGNDLAIVTNIENQCYLAMFGGNVEQSTSNETTNNNQDFWGNNLLMPNDSVIQFNSLTERTLLTTPLTSAGRVIIENAIKEDLSFLNIISITVTIVATDRLEVEILGMADEEAGQVFNIYFNIQYQPAGSFSISEFDLSFE